MVFKRAVPAPTVATGLDPAVLDQPAHPPRARIDRRAAATAWVRSNPLVAGAMAAGLLARILFWAATNRLLDDSLITIKFDKNLADGFGMVHNLGEGHVQGFTSALSVLVPLPGELVAPRGGFLLIRLVSLACFLAAVVYARRICDRLSLGAWPTGFLLAYLALDPLQVYFGVVGMETQIVTAVLLAGVYYVLTEDYVKSGVALGLAILARPDFVLWVAPALVYLFVRNRRAALRSAAIAAAVVAPWLIFTTVYYGSPVPNTIAAKSAAFAPTLPPLLHIGAWLHFLHVTINQHSNEWMSIAPFYEKALVIRAPVANGLLEAIALVVVALAIVGAVRTWPVKGLRAALAYLLMFEAYKVIFLTLGYFDWYGPPAYALLMIFAAAGLETVSGLASRAIPGQRRLSPAALAAVPAACLAVAYAAPLPFFAVSERRIQRIEDTVRTPLGQYLGQVTRIGQTYTSESSGYVGWYTNAHLYDFPGLESPRVAKLERTEGLSWAHNHSPIGLASPQAIAYFLRPDWVILRPGEYHDFKTRFPAVASQYRLVRVFGSLTPSQQIDVGGMLYLSTDGGFAVLRKVRQ